MESMYKNYQWLIAYNFIKLSLKKLCSKGTLEFNGCQLLSPRTEITLKGANAMIALGRGTFTRAGVALLADNGTIDIGNSVFVNRNSFFTSLERIKIGDNCSFGPNVMIFDHDHVFGRQSKEGFRTSPIEIGNRVWIGANVVILRGSRVGDGCVVGAGTVLRGHIPKNSLVVSSRELRVEPLR